MIKIHTQLHLALLLNDRLKIDNRDCFLLGSVYSNICDLTFKEADNK